MTALNKQALRDNANSIIGILENIAGYEPSDIDGDNVELRFEDECGVDTGCDVSIVDQCHKAADVMRSLLDDLEAAEKRIAELDASHSKQREGMAAIYNAICENGASTSLSAILTFVKRSREESASAAGIGVKGE
ncbi:hypothetical protein [Escherichia coli]|uniref:hypothetical protein n=1 Tax=Escherichia coli TaxID=562 RepID=UPI0039851939